MLIAQITDLHIKPPGQLAYGRVDTAAYLERAVAALLALDPQPDVVIATGDLVDVGDPEEYGRLRQLLAPLAPPLYVVPGNHDARRPLRAAFAGEGYLPADGAFLHYTVEDWPVRLIGLDTQVAGEASGALCAERLAWLAARLAEQPERPTLLFMHHPPFATGIEHMDAMGLAGAAELAAIVRRHPQVERIACGHVHRSIQTRFAGTLASIAPSTAHQVALDLRPAAEASFTFEPPGFHLHLWQPGGGIVTYTAHTESFAGPYPFDGADPTGTDA
jgi:3',5'-cyclic-AMP phosphodiesterase